MKTFFPCLGQYFAVVFGACLYFSGISTGHADTEFGTTQPLFPVATPQAGTSKYQDAKKTRGKSRAGIDNSDGESARLPTEVRAGASAGLNISATLGNGLLVRGLYRPSQVKGADKVNWVGLLQALWVDKYLNLREDSDGDGALTKADKIIRFTAVDGKTRVSRYVTSDEGKTVTLAEKGLEMDAIVPLWETRDELARISNSTVQRRYAAPASRGRYIISSVDADRDGIARADDQVDFVARTFAPGRPASEAAFRMLGLDSSRADEYANIVNYIRGDETIDAYRSRTIDFDNDGEGEPWILGDIMHSSPLIVAEPKFENRFDIQYQDDSYTAYYQKAIQRRRMVYFGANDGMLHAVNAGFYDRESRSFKTALDKGSTQHALGAELWAYVPYSALPYLQGLTSQNATHAYYVDGIPQSFDVNIFPNDADHPNGWGTILVVGMRFGGSVYKPDPLAQADAISLLSSYIIFDVTNPEQAPQLLAEISHPRMGYTTGRPTIMMQRKPHSKTGSFLSPEKNAWYLVIGSGPYGDDTRSREWALGSAVSNQNAKLFVFDLINKHFVNAASGENYFEIPGASDGFVGDVQAADWDRDYQSDVAYFGIVSGDVSQPGGAFKRFQPGRDFSWSGSRFSTLLSDLSGGQQPFMGQAHVLKRGGDNWLFTGSGRYLVAEDSSNAGQMGFYAVKDNNYQNGLAISVSGMLDVSGFTLEHPEPKTNTNIAEANIFSHDGDASQAVHDFPGLQKAVKSLDGWYMEFAAAGERSVGRADSNGETLVFRSYVPSTDRGAFGESFTNSVYFAVGVGPPFGNGTETSRADPDAMVLSRQPAGMGLIRDVQIGEQGFVSGGTGVDGDTKNPRKLPASPVPAGRMSWREILCDLCSP